MVKICFDIFPPREKHFGRKMIFYKRPCIEERYLQFWRKKKQFDAIFYLYLKFDLFSAYEGVL